MNFYLFTAWADTPFLQAAKATCRLVSIFIYLKLMWIQQFYFLFDSKADRLVLTSVFSDREDITDFQG